MFIINKYTTWYMNIVQNAREKDRRKSKSHYLEEHHIIPRCMGGDDTKENLVLLTFKEHFICHRLLCKMVSDKNHKSKMLYALFRMSHVGDKTQRNLTEHQKFRCLESNRIASRTRNHKPNLGKKHTEESKQKIREAATGKKHTEETKQKIRENNIKTNASRAKKISEYQTGRTKSEEHKKKLSEAAKAAWAKRKSGRG